MFIKDNKNELWYVEFNNPVVRHLHNGEAYYKIWVDVPIRPKEFKNYEDIPIPVFTDWWKTTTEDTTRLAGDMV